MAATAQAMTPATSGLTTSALPLRGALVGALVLLIPLGVVLWLLRIPATAPTPAVSFEHLVVVTNVSFLALLVAVLVAKSALDQHAYRVLFLAFGFLSMGGFFTVHALATPGVILPPSGLVFSGGSYHQEHGAASVLGISAYLSLLVPALFFAARYLPLKWEAADGMRALTRIVAAVLAVVLVVYGVLGLTSPEIIAAIPLLDNPVPYCAAAVTIGVLLYAAWRQGREFMGSRLPMQLALVGAFLLLADAQVAMVITPVWSLSWWCYHILMLLAVLLALWALFIELDRRRGFERFLSPAVIDRVMAGTPIALGGERKMITVLFGDLRNSTAISEKLAPDAVVSLLNCYVGTMAQCVFDNGGVLDKYLGDGLMAIFGVPPDPSHGARSAVRAAVAIRAALTSINDERAAHGQDQVGFGIGIHTGEVVLGAVGIPRRSDYTAIGDTVNTASRLEGLCKEYHVNAVLSADVAELIDRSAVPLRQLGSAVIRGKARELNVFTLADGNT
jgi:class 3 adenylate cyclase